MASRTDGSEISPTYKLAGWPDPVPQIPEEDTDSFYLHCLPPAPLTVTCSSMIAEEQKERVHRKVQGPHL